MFAIVAITVLLVGVCLLGFRCWALADEVERKKTVIASLENKRWYNTDTLTFYMDQVLPALGLPVHLEVSQEQVLEVIAGLKQRAREAAALTLELDQTKALAEKRIRYLDAIAAAIPKENAIGYPGELCFSEIPEWIEYCNDLIRDLKAVNVRQANELAHSQPRDPETGRLVRKNIGGG